MQRRLLIVEDEPMAAGLLRETLSTENFDIRVAHSSAEATHICKNFDPDLAIVDINLGRGPNGVDLAFILNEENPGIAILLLTQHPDLRTAGISAADLPGGCGFLRKEAVTNKAVLLTALDQLIDSTAPALRQDNDLSRPLSNLTKTQVEILRMVAQGYTNQEIANRRNTSTQAVEQVLNAVFLALGIEGDGINRRVEAVRRFINAAGAPERT